MDAQGMRVVVGRGETKLVPLTEEDLAQRQKDHDKWLAKLEEERNAPPPFDPIAEIKALKAALIKAQVVSEAQVEAEKELAQGGKDESTKGIEP